LETLKDVDLDPGLGLLSLGCGGREDSVGVGKTGSDALYV
jgi:hypothetical protein